MQNNHYDIDFRNIDLTFNYYRNSYKSGTRPISYFILRKYLIRKEKDITKPEERLQHAREEEHIQKEIQQERYDLSIKLMANSHSSNPSYQQRFDHRIHVRKYELIINEDSINIKTIELIGRTNLEMRHHKLLRI